MIDWNKILESHVIKVVSDTCYKRWGLGIQIYDKSGNNTNNEDLHLKNTFCHSMYLSKEGVKRCRHCYREHLKELDKSCEYFSYKCHAGLLVVTIPIIVDEEYVGAVVGSGIQLTEINNPERVNYIKELSGLDIGDTSIERNYKSLIRLNGLTEGLVIDFIKMVARDIQVNYKTQNDRIHLKNNQEIVRKHSQNKKYKNIITNSRSMKEIFDVLDKIEKTEKTILIEGETGTGKELLAAAIHCNSSRKDKVFIVQNCSAFNDALLTSELFGHEKGSFTGAISDKKGLFQIAEGGTLFLDEIGEMSIENQANLLRILEDGTFYRLGGSVLHRADVRIIAATNRDLKKQVEKGLFRKDLYFRVNSFPVNIPPLRARKVDIILLVYYFLETYAETHNTTQMKVSREVLELLENYDWPGNIRELRNQVERLIILSCDESTIEANLLPGYIKGNSSTATCERRAIERYTLKDSLKTLERVKTEDELRKAKWNKTLAARKLGISRASLNNKIENFNIFREQLLGT